MLWLALALAPVMALPGGIPENVPFTFSVDVNQNVEHVSVHAEDALGQEISLLLVQDPTIPTLWRRECHVPLGSVRYSYQLAMENMTLGEFSDGFRRERHTDSPVVNDMFGVVSRISTIPPLPQLQKRRMAGEDYVEPHMGMFDDEQLVSFHLVFLEGPPPPSPEKDYVPANLSFVSAQSAVSLSNVGVRRAGGSSLYLEPFSYVVHCSKYVKKQRLFGVKKFFLKADHEGTLGLRMKLSADLSFSLGYSGGMRVSFARVSVEGHDNGVYLLKERFEPQFLKMIFGTDGVGNLYKADSGNLHNPSELTGFDLKEENTTQGAWTDLRDLATLANQRPANATLLQQSIDVSDFVLASALGLVQWDSDNLLTSNLHNYYWYHDAAATRWNMLYWDQDGSFSTTFKGFDKELDGNSSLCVLLNAFAGIPELKQAIEDKICLLGSVVTPNRDSPMWQRVAALRQFPEGDARYQPAAYDDLEWWLETASKGVEAFCGSRGFQNVL